MCELGLQERRTPPPRLRRCFERPCLHPGDTMETHSTMRSLQLCVFLHRCVAPQEKCVRCRVVCPLLTYWFNSLMTSLYVWLYTWSTESQRTCRSVATRTVRVRTHGAIVHACEQHHTSMSHTDTHTQSIASIVNHLRITSATANMIIAIRIVAQTAIVMASFMIASPQQHRRPHHPWTWWQCWTCWFRRCEVWWKGTCMGSGQHTV